MGNRSCCTAWWRRFKCVTSRSHPLPCKAQPPPRLNVEMLEWQKCSMDSERVCRHTDDAGNGGYSLTSPCRNLQASPNKHSSPNSSFCNTWSLTKCKTPLLKELSPESCECCWRSCFEVRRGFTGSAVLLWFCPKGSSSLLMGRGSTILAKTRLQVADNIWVKTHTQLHYFSLTSPPKSPPPGLFFEQHLEKFC